MFKISHKTIENSEPWLIPVSKRLNYLYDSILGGYKITLLIYQASDTSTFRYRGYNIYQIMKNSAAWRAVFFFMNELELIEDFLTKVDIVTIIRVKWTNELQKLVDLAKYNGTPVLFDIDDRVFDLNSFALITNTLGVNFSVTPEIQYDFWFAYISRIELAAQQADNYICTNKFLLNAVQKKFNKTGYIIPNFLNMEQLSISEKCIAQKKGQMSDSKFVIGYFSGTPSHVNDLKVVYMQIIRLLEEFDNFFLKVVGFMTFPPEMQKYISAGRVEISPLVNFIELQELMAEVDVNIVPLVVNDFTNCKSELKFFEGAIVNTITVASKTFAYKSCITNNENGFLCDPTEWYLTLKNIYQNKNNLKKIIDNAHDYAIDNYSGERILNQIESVYNQVLIDYKR